MHKNDTGCLLVAVLGAGLLAGPACTLAAIIAVGLIVLFSEHE